MSGMVLATSAGQSVKKVFCVRPCGVLVRRSQRAQVGWDRFYPLLNLWIPRIGQRHGAATTPDILWDLRLHFDLDTLPKVLGEGLSYSKATAPILILYDERVMNCAALLAEECISSLPENRMYGESLTMALMAALFASHEASNRVVNSGLARWQLRHVLEFLEAHLTEDIGLDELAQLVSLSVIHLAGKRAFRGSGCTSSLFD